MFPNSSRLPVGIYIKSKLLKPDLSCSPRGYVSMIYVYVYCIQENDHWKISFSSKHPLLEFERLSTRRRNQLFLVQKTDIILLRGVLDPKKSINDNLSMCLLTMKAMQSRIQRSGKQNFIQIGIKMDVGIHSWNFT